MILILVILIAINWVLDALLDYQQRKIDRIKKEIEAKHKEILLTKCEILANEALIDELKNNH